MIDHAKYLEAAADFFGGKENGIRKMASVMYLHIRDIDVGYDRYIFLASRYFNLGPQYFFPRESDESQRQAKYTYVTLGRYLVKALDSQ